MFAWAHSPALAGQNPKSGIVLDPIVSVNEFGEILEQIGVAETKVAPVCRAVYDDYVKEFERARELMREKASANARHGRGRMIAADPTGAGPVPYPNVYQDWGLRRTAMDKEFLADVAAVLDGAMREAWLRVARRFYRERLLRDVALWHAIRRAVDIIPIVESVVSEEELAGVTPLLTEYGSRIDAALESLLHESPILVERYLAQIDQAGNAEEKHRLVDESRGEYNRFCYDVEETNKRYAVLISNELPLEKGRIFLEKAYAASYPEIFATSPVEYVAGRLTEVELSPETTRDLEEIIAQYTPVQRTIRMRIARAWEQWDTLETRNKLGAEKREAVRTHGPRVHLVWDVFPAKELWLRHREISLSTCRSLRQALSEEEFESLPLDVRLMLSWW